MLYVELANTPYLQSKGLMFRKNLDDDAGMLFAFSHPQVLKFWGRNTYLPLDIAFVSPEKKIIKIDRIRPLNVSSVSSDIDCIMAIETNEGYFQKNGIKLGDIIELAKNDLGFDIVQFKKREGN